MDLSAFDTPTSTTDLETVRTLATELRDLETEIAELEETLKLLKGRANDLKTQELPEALGDLGMESFSLSDGFSVKINEVVSGTLPKDPAAKRAALALLAEYGLDGIIKNEISLAFGRGEDNIAKSLAAELREKGYEADVTEGVHPQTLAAAVRERLRSGEEVDTQALGIYCGRTVKTSFGKVR
jgi:hypothetical protein